MVYVVQGGIEIVGISIGSEWYGLDYCDVGYIIILEFMLD